MKQTADSICVARLANLQDIRKEQGMNIFKRRLMAFTILACAAAISNAGFAQDVVYTLDFSQQKDGPAKQRLLALGFELQQSALVANGFADANKIKLQFANGRLYIDTLKPAFGVLSHNRQIGDSSKIRITWGVDRYPQNASYEGGENDEAVMIIVYFGDARFSSGNFFVRKKLPYFIGLFPSQLDKQNKHYLGKLYKSCGRYACIAKPQPGQQVVSEYDLAANFKEQFQTSSIPPIKGFALEVDTQESGGGGRAKAFIEKIEFLK